MKFGQLLGGLAAGGLLGAMSSGKMGDSSFGHILQGLFNPLGLLGHWGGGKYPLIGGHDQGQAPQGGQVPLNDMANPVQAVPGALDPSQFMQNYLGQLGNYR